MKASISVLGFAVAAAALSVPRNASKRKPNAIDPNDFVYVDGLRLKDATGLHYVTVGARILNVTSN